MAIVVNTNNKMPKSNIKSVPIQNKSVIIHVCLVLFIVCLYICVCECLLQNINRKTKHKNNTNRGSALEPGASGLPYYCTSICVCFGCTRLASCVDSKPKKQKKSLGHNAPPPQKNSPNMAPRHPSPHSHTHSSPRDTLVQHVTCPATVLAQSPLCPP